MASDPWSPASAASRKATSQNLLLRRLSALSQYGFDRLFRRMAERRLSEAEHHFRRHRREFVDLEVHTQETYLALFEHHICRPDLLRFAAYRVRDRHVMWYLIAPDTGAVAQYNETKGTWWSFYRPKDVIAFMDAGRGWWVKVEQTASGWRMTSWT